MVSDEQRRYLSLRAPTEDNTVLMDLWPPEVRSRDAAGRQVHE